MKKNLRDAIRGLEGPDCLKSARFLATGYKSIRHFKDTEFEVKFDSLMVTTNPERILHSFTEGFRLSYRYEILPVGINGDYKVLYFMSKEGKELSLFRNEGKEILKVKTHDVLNVQGFRVFKSLEKHHVGKSSIQAALPVDMPRFIGVLRKHRAKDFVVDMESGIYYSLSVTVCTAKNATQRQVEIEYAGHILSAEQKGYLDTPCENEIIESLVDFAHEIQQVAGAMISPSTERKADFVSAVYSKATEVDPISCPSDILQQFGIV